jgi:DNA polymerase-3 subunit delta
MAQTRKSAPSLLEAVKNVKKGKLLPIYYLFGEDAYSLSSAVKTIEETIAPLLTSDFDKDVLYSDDKSLEDVLSNARAFPFGSQKKLIIYKEVEKVKDKKLMEGYISSPADFTVLVLIHNGKIVSLSSSPFNFLLENNYLYEAKELKGEAMIDWLKELASSKEKSISNENAALLADICGDNRVLIENQLEKIIDFLGDGNEITFNSIKEATASVKEYTVFDLQNAVFRKDKAESLKIAFNILEQGENASFIVSMLTKSFIGLAQMRELKEKNTPDNEAAKIVGTHPFYLKNYQRAAILFSQDDLIKASEALLKADVSIKTTSIDQKTVITLLVAELFK